jgi:hypothetical protein
MRSSIREFGFKVPVSARSDGKVADGHLRLKAARKSGCWPGGDTSRIRQLQDCGLNEAVQRGFWKTPLARPLLVEGAKMRRVNI